MKSKKIAYYIFTVGMSLIFLFSASMYFLKNEMVQGFFETLGFPSWLVYPLAIAKILGVVAVLSRKSTLLKEWAYAGFFFDALLATAAHWIQGDGLGLSVIAIILIVASRYMDGRVFIASTGHQLTG